MEFGTQCVSTDETLAVITVTSTVRTARSFLWIRHMPHIIAGDWSGLERSYWYCYTHPRLMKRSKYVGYLFCLSANNMNVAVYAVDILMSIYLYILIYWYVLVVKFLHQPHPDTERQFQLPPSFMSLFYNVFFPLQFWKNPASVCGIARHQQ